MVRYCKQLIHLIWILLLFSACSVYNNTSVKNYPVDTPFVFDNKIVLDGSHLSGDENAQMNLDLPNYWSDSANANRFRRYMFLYRINNPPKFDTSNITKSKKYMKGYLQTKGYFQPIITDTFYFDSTSFPGQDRTFIQVNINPNKPTIIDSVHYNLPDSSILKVIEQKTKMPNIVVGKTHFSNAPVSNELDRIIKLYRNNGYYRLQKQDLIAVVDTNDITLLKMTIDPFEQAMLLAQSASSRKNYLKASVDFTKRMSIDSLKYESSKEAFVKYKIGRVYIFPETSVTDIPDTVMKHGRDFDSIFRTRNRMINIYSNEQKFKPRPILEHLFTHPGDIYSDSMYLKTINNISNIGAWQSVDSRAITIQDSTLDLFYFLVPNIKQSMSYDFEVSRNTGDYITSSFGSNFLGLAVNVTHKNRNTWHRAIQSSTSLRNGVELNLANSNGYSSILQTIQSSITQSYVFPKFITPFRIRDRTSDGIKSVLNVTGSYQDRRDYFKLKSIVANWGYEWRSKNITWQYRPLNIELYSLDTLTYLYQALVNSPYIRNAFNTGAVVSQQLNMAIAYSDKNHPQNANYVSVGFEESGTLLGRFKPLKGNIYQYVKLQAEYRKQVNFHKTQLAFRAMAGVAFNYNGDGKFGGTLPFYKQFFGGGPNSMRAWGLRQIGLGSSLLSDTSSTFRDRYGDMQMEVNAEYRYPIFVVGSMKVKGAMFVDAGNVWDVRTNTSNPQGVFNINNLGHDIAIGVGTGLRLDFDYFLIRLDLGIKVKDPARDENGGWMDFSKFSWRNKEYTIINPITNQQVYRNNYALQLGIGLPF
ncbi:BamA/TamA family outer membrane protein [Rhizosphaericola mali]|uniref:BamA/TamA family outer membrane protein n=1 Tax=Rhizosphaericola mali TaxID=2545455 RepID=A0A5P2G505_9BACT|nr:BamA/TamA family outer membrane protein [Rhizosphaericola mali]